MTEPEMEFAAEEQKLEIEKTVEILGSGRSITIKAPEKDEQLMTAMTTMTLSKFHIQMPYRAITRGLWLYQYLSLTSIAQNSLIF